ncbi:MAG: HAD family phosphatase [Spirochaetes bacterium]|nr:HAD family phosphatase [Spirochaetota bacterium]
MRTEGLTEAGSNLSGQSAALKTIIFDCGRVLTRDQDREIAKTMAGILGAELGEFRSVYATERQKYDRGVETAREYWDRVASTWGTRLDDADLARMVRLDMDSWFTINPDTVALVAELKAKGFRLLVLSNMNLEGKERLMGPARFLDGRDWLSDFDEVLLSCDLKLLKPERRIYEACLEKTLAPAGACLFIDDIEANVFAARASGMKAVLFTDIPGLRATLARDYCIG